MSEKHEKHLNEKESLALITEMIKEAKANYGKGGSFYFLLWGWIVMFANFGHYILDVYVNYAYPYIVWIVTVPAVVISIIYGVQNDKKSIAVSHLERIYSQIWMALGIAMAVTLVFMARISYNHNAIILLLAGSGTFISGQMIRFMPLMLGGFSLWVASVIAFNVPVTDQYLVGGIGILLGYLIPGYLLKNKEK